MNFSDYQQKAITTDVYGGKPVPITDVPFVNKVLGLCGEAGEVAEKIKKLQRNQGGKVTTQDRADIAKELGDVLWYLSAIAHYLEIDLDDIAQQNIDKLFDRKKRGTIKSQGDNR